MQMIFHRGRGSRKNLLEKKPTESIRVLFRGGQTDNKAIDATTNTELVDEKNLSTEIILLLPLQVPKRRDRCLSGGVVSPLAVTLISPKTKSPLVDVLGYVTMP